MKRWFWFSTLLMGAVGAAPLFSDSGFLTTRAGGDSPFNLFRLHQLYTALQDGVFPVRWMPDAAFGLGYPFFNFYAALPYYFAALLKAVGFSYVLSLKLVVLLGFMTAAVGMYGWVSATTRRESTALLAAAAYTFAPYHLVNIYVRGDSLSEFWAMAWYPIILWALHAAAFKPTRLRLAGVALAYGALVMTHNISALIFSPFAALYGGVLVFQSQTRIKTLLTLGGAGMLGLLLAAWFWIPAITEQNTVQLDDQTTGYFFYGNHFRQANLIQANVAHDYNAVGAEANPFSMGLVQAFFIILGLIVLLIHFFKRRWQGGFVLVGLLLSTFMITPHSERLWDLIPLLSLAQFPWRFLAVQALFGAAVTGFLFPSPLVGEGLGVRGETIRNILIAVLLSFWLGFAALSNLKTDFMPIRDKDITAERLHWYEAFTGNIGTTIRAEYLPVDAMPRPYTSDAALQRAPRVKLITGTGSGQLLEKSAARQQWEIEVTSQEAQIALPLLYWPGWKVINNGREIAASAVDGLGYIQFTLPAGQHQVELRLTHTPRRLFAEFISLAAFLTLISLIIPTVDFRAVSRVHLQKAGVGTALVLLVLALLQLRTKNSDVPTLISADFAQASYFHFGEIPYENGMTLEKADYRLEGTNFSYDFAWSPRGESVISRLDIASPLPVYFLGGPMFPVQTGTPDNFSGNKYLPHLTPGLYFPRILLFEQDSPTTQETPRISPLTSHDVGRGDIYLAPVVVTAQAAVEENPTQQVTLGPLHLLAATTRGDEEYLHLTLWWETLAEVPTQYGIDFQLFDADGTQWARHNALMGGAGMYPTALWQPDEIIPDNYRLPLPYGIPPAAYHLYINIYHPVTLESLYQADIPEVQQTYVSEYTCPLPQNSAYHDGLRVNELIVPPTVQRGNALTIDMVWSASTPPQENYQLAWTLQNDTGTVWKTQTSLAPGSDATTWQTDSACGAYILAHHRLNIPETLVPGFYTLTMQLLSEEGEALVAVYEAAQVEVAP